MSYYYRDFARLGKWGDGFVQSSTARKDPALPINDTLMTDEERIFHLETFKANTWDFGSRFEVSSGVGVTQLVLKRPKPVDYVRSIVFFITFAVVAFYFFERGNLPKMMFPVGLATVGAVAILEIYLTKTKHLPPESVLLVWHFGERILEAPLSQWTVPFDQIDGVDVRYVPPIRRRRGHISFDYECLYVVVHGESHLIYATQSNGLLKTLEKFSASTGIGLMEPGPNETRMVYIDC